MWGRMARGAQWLKPEAPAKQVALARRAARARLAARSGRVASWGRAARRAREARWKRVEPWDLAVNLAPEEPSRVAGRATADARAPEGLPPAARARAVRTARAVPTARAARAGRAAPWPRPSVGSTATVACSLTAARVWP